MATLYEKLGGQPAISSVVDKFYEYTIEVFQKYMPLVAYLLCQDSLEKNFKQYSIRQKIYYNSKGVKNKIKNTIVSAFFTNTDMSKQAKRQKEFITLVTGGPNLYEGVDMAKAHAKMKIHQNQFDATWQNLLKSLNDHKVPQNLIQELKEIFYSVQGDVVNVK